MDELRERTAYLQGLTEGLKLDEGKDEQRILKQIVDIIADLTDEVEDLQVSVEDLEDYLECFDDELFDDDDDDEIDLDDDDDECELLDDDITYVEVECPQCHDIICFESEIIDDEDIIEVTCPNCTKVVFVNDGSMSLPEDWEKKNDGEERE
ncbi:MAG: AraC family transcriptional regulator [Syntrophaceticus sp.]|jgi:phage FluMu protein Com|nr:AraC family transcriptional regulator [Syntrophaceticus sp.]MDD3315271.1 AraC family transcriptional regulator [Syntrophaceticus sp.]MDD4359708.1 AraC family transcriptional regulator [Syntrophaceticus sp.]MDD4782962.1 AraC family transcriptional regulator [Syntrophaceticus sp.]